MTLKTVKVKFNTYADAKYASISVGDVVEHSDGKLYRVHRFSSQDIQKEGNYFFLKLFVKPLIKTIEC